MRSPAPSPLLLSLLIVLLLAGALAQTSAGLPEPRCDVVIVGAGIGGLYTAYRLALEARTVPPSAVCIFEARSRPGGRILSVNDPLPGYRGFTVDLGAYRYRRDQHVLTRLLTEDVLGLQTTCYTRALRSDDPAAPCPPGPPRRVLSLRGDVFSASPAGGDLQRAFANFSARIPYNVPPAGRWGVPGPGANLTGPRDAGTLIATLLDPATTPLRPIAQHMPVVLDPASDYAAAMDAADRIIAALPNERLFGVPLEQLTAWEYAVKAGIAPDERRLITDLGGIVLADAMHSPLKDRLAAIIRDRALAKTPLTGPSDAYVIPLEKRRPNKDHDFPPRASLMVIIDELLARLQGAGVRVYFNARATDVQRTGPAAEGRMRVTLLRRDADGAETPGAVETGTVILNIPKNALQALGAGSEPMRSGGAPLANALSRLFGTTLGKTYCFWREAWWVSKLNFTDGSFRSADEPLFEGRYHDGDVQCADARNTSTCRGSLLVSYVGGSSVGTHDAAFLSAINDMPYGPFARGPGAESNARFLVPGNMTPHEQTHFDLVHQALRRVHKGTFAAFGHDVRTDLPDADGCVYANWVGVGSHRPRGGAVDPDSEQPLRLFARPVPGLNLSLVNEAYTDEHGWAEGSLRAAERALFHVHGVARPAWLDAVTHRSLIEKFNVGKKIPFGGP